MARIVGEIVENAFKLLTVLSFLVLGVGMMRRSRPLLMLGGSLLGSVILSFVLGLLGLPIGIVFGFLGGGLFFRPRKAKTAEEYEREIEEEEAELRSRGKPGP